MITPQPIRRTSSDKRQDQRGIGMVGSATARVALAQIGGQHVLAALLAAS